MKITALGNALEFEQDFINYPSAVFIDSTHVMAFWTGTALDGFCRIFEINTSDGSITGLGSVLEFDTVEGGFNSAFLIDSTHVMNFWRGPDQDGFCRIFEINVADGSITALGSALEFDTADNSFNSAFLIDSTHVMNFWTGPNNDGFCRIFEINVADGSITALGTVFEFDIANGQSISAFLIDSTHVMCFWQSTSVGYGQIFEINVADGSITALGSPHNIGTSSSNSAFLIDPTHVMNFWQGTDQDGFCRIFEINVADGSITALGSALEFDAVGNSQNAALLLNSTKAVNFWRGGVDSFGYGQVFNFNTSTGEITVGDLTLFDSNSVSVNSVAKIDTTVVMNFWQGADQDGFCQIFSIDLDDNNIIKNISGVLFDNIKKIGRTAIASVAAFAGVSTWLPSFIIGITFWTKALSLSSTDFNEPDFHLNNEINAALNAKIFTGGAGEVISANSDRFSLGNIGTIYGVEFWIKLTSNTEKVLDLNGTANIEVVTGTITVNNWSGTTIKVNDAVSSTLDTSWKHVFITSSTSISASAVFAGLVGGVYGDFMIKDLVFYTAEPSVSNYNTPQELQEIESAVIVPFYDETYLNNRPVTIINGTDGTFLTSAAAGYNAAENGIEVGFQAGLANYNRSQNWISKEINTWLVAPRFTYILNQNDPLGGNRAFLCTHDNTNTLMRHIDFGGVTWVNGNTYTFSVWVKGHETTVGKTVHIDIGDKSIVIATLTDSWQRISTTRTVDGTEYAQHVDITPNINVGESFYVFGYMFHEGSGLLPFIPPLGTGTNYKKIFETTPLATTDIYGNDIFNPITEGMLNFQGEHGGISLQSALGNTRTFAFYFWVESAATDQVIFDLGTPADIAIVSSAITCASFSSIVVNGSGNTVTDGWNYVELKNTTSVNLDGLDILSTAFRGILAEAFATASELFSATESAKLRQYYQNKFGS